MTTRKYFGTDGIRGRYGEMPIQPAFMTQLGWAAGIVLSRNKKIKVLIGRDTRVSGEELELALQKGLVLAGAEVYSLSVIPTPAVAYLTRALQADVGVVISASHNPYEDNGVKFFNSNGMKLSDAIELSIEEKIDQCPDVASVEISGKVNVLDDAQQRYIDFCKQIFPENLSLKGLKIILDCANGSGFHVAPIIFSGLGAEVVAIHHQPDGYNINAHCGATDVQSLQEMVVKESADIGIAFDGDGDRLMMVDHRGERVDGDEMLCILAHDTHAKNASKGIVGTVMSNLGLEQSLKEKGIEFVRAKVGDRYVLEELLAHQWSLGGEASGHIVNLDLATTGDGIVSALQILRVMQSQSKTLNELKKEMTKRPHVLINVRVSNPNTLSQYSKITEAVASAERSLGDTGRILLRPSGTEPYVRVMVEGNDESQVSSLAESLAKIVRDEMTGTY